MPLRPRRLLAALVLVGALLLSGGVGVAPSDAAPRGSGLSADQQRVRELVNQTRGSNRLLGLTMNKQFADRAQMWAQELARCRCLKHRNGPYGAPPGWYAAAENVGRGWSLAQVHQAFMGSRGHRENILTRRFTHIGTGVARSANGEIFVVQAFMDRTA